MAPEEFSTVGLTMCTVGAIFLSRSILIKRPRRVVEEFFGVNAGNIASIRHYIDAKHHVFSGCAFLVLGFAVQLVGLLLIRPATEPANPNILMVEGAVVLVLGVICWVVTTLMSRNSLQRYLREFFQRNPWPFEKNIALSREIGDLFGIPYNPDDTIESYLSTLRKTLQIPEQLQKSKSSNGDLKGKTPYF